MHMTRAMIGRIMPCFAVCLALSHAALTQETATPQNENAEARLFRQLTKNSKWERESAVALNFDTYHPQGMTFVGERIFLSSVEVIHRGRGEGKGHLFETDMEGNLKGDLLLGEGAMYHPGGIDFDGEQIWVSVAEYRPDSRSIVYAVNPSDMSYREVFRFDDHLGAVVHDTTGNTLIGVSWGSRRIYRWELERAGGEWHVTEPSRPTVANNSNHYVDFQDMQFLRGTNTLLASGLNRYRVGGEKKTSVALGGIDLIDVRTLSARHQIPVTLWVGADLAMTNNPFYVRAKDGVLLFYFAPEDNKSRLFTYRVR